MSEEAKIRKRYLTFVSCCIVIAVYLEERIATLLWIALQRVPRQLQQTAVNENRNCGANNLVTAAGCTNTGQLLIGTLQNIYWRLTKMGHWKKSEGNTISDYC
jgi:hypothetical protein